jgi:hypothetical protein
MIANSMMASRDNCRGHNWMFAPPAYLIAASIKDVVAG